MKLLHSVLGSCFVAVLGCSTASSEIAIAIEEPDFEICNCHHGFGFGIDGSANLVVANVGEANGLLTIKSVRLTAEQPETIVEVEDSSAVAEFYFGPDHDDLSFRFTRPAPVGTTGQELLDQAGSYGWGSHTRTIGLSAGSIETIGLRLHFDPLVFQEIVQDGNASYGYEVAFEVDGRSEVLTGSVPLRFRNYLDE